MIRLLIASLMLVHIACSAAATETPVAAEPSEEIQSVAVSGVRNPGMRNYRGMLAGLDMFESKRQMAPTADILRFRLKPRYADEPLAGVTLRIAGGDTSIHVPIAADGTFVLPRDQAAEDSDADLILNRPKGGWNGMPHIRSANVPANMRRLGDVRLECQVAIAIGKTELNFALRAAATVVMAGTDWCQSKRISYGTDAPMPSDSITLVSGERRVVMHMGRHQKYFSLPIHDRSWPDDTLIEFQPSAPATVTEFASETLYLRGSMNKWGTSLPMQQVDASNFRVDAVLTKGVNKFRISAKDSRKLDIGATDAKANETKGNFKLNAGTALAWGGGDVWFEPPQPGTYTFALNAADPQAPVVTITQRE